MASASKKAASRLANNIHNANFWTVGSLFRQPNINNCHVDRWMSVFVVIFIIITIMMIRYVPAPRKLRRGGGQTVSLGILVGVGMYFRIFFFFSKGTVFSIFVIELLSHLKLFGVVFSSIHSRLKILFQNLDSLQLFWVNIETFQQ